MRTILLINLSLFGILCSKMACLLDDKGEQLLQNRRFRVYQLGVKLKTSPSSHVKPLNLKIYQRPTDAHFNIQLRFSTNFLRLTQQILEKHPPKKSGRKKLIINQPTLMDIGKINSVESVPEVPTSPHPTSPGRGSDKAIAVGDCGATRGHGELLGASQLRWCHWPTN